MACESQVVMTHFRCSDGSTINWPYLDLALGETCTHKDDTCQPFSVTFSQPHLSEGQYLYCQDLLILTSKCWLKCQKDLFASKSQDDLHIKGMYNVYLKTECEEGCPTKQGGDVLTQPFQAQVELEVDDQVSSAPGQLLSVSKCQSVKAWFLSYAVAAGKKRIFDRACCARGQISKCQGWDGKPMIPSKDLGLTLFVQKCSLVSAHYCNNLLRLANLQQS